MTKPRLIEPGSSYHISRRTNARLFLTRPDPEIIDLFVYCFAEGAQRYGIEVFRLVIMSNHYHAVLRDKRGHISLFLQWVHREIARGIKRQRGWDSSVFDGGQATGMQALCTAKAFWQAMRYVGANPVRAGLVKRAGQWPGTLTPAGVRALGAPRPGWMTEKSGKAAHHTLRICPAPAQLQDCELSEDDYHLALAEHDLDEQRDARAQMRAEGRHRFAGKDKRTGKLKAMAVHPLSAPRTKPLKGKLTPHIWAVSKDGLKEAKAKLKSFYDAYRQALDAFRKGRRNTQFPLGTWKMAHIHRCCLAPPPD